MLIIIYYKKKTSLMMDDLYGIMILEIILLLFSFSRKSSNRLFPSAHNSSGFRFLALDSILWSRP